MRLNYTSKLENFGKVPFQEDISKEIQQILDALFDKLSLSKKDTDMLRFSNRMDHLSENNDPKDRK
jgi:hypothetical protein